jgi:hypothetical protein
VPVLVTPFPTASARESAAHVPRPRVSLFTRLGKLQHAGVRPAVLLLALVLIAPALFSGFAEDDYILLYELREHADSEWAGSPPFDLFKWMDPAHALRLRDGAGLPWWTYEQSVFACLRPVASLTHTLDQQLAPNNAFWAHLHSLLWFTLLVTLCWRAYQLLLDIPWVVALASTMFALDAAHGSTVGWIANRNALIGATLAVAALLCHHVRCSKGSRVFVLGAWCCFALGLLSSELALGALGYLISYEIFFDRARLITRWRKLAPYGLIVLVWGIARHVGGYGSYRLYTYVDPLHEPWAFLRTLPERLVILVASQATHLSSDLSYSVSPTVRPWYLGAALLCCAVTCWFVWPSLRASRGVRFFAAGALLSALPLAATLPSDRLLTLIGFGVFAVLAHAIYLALRDVRARLRWRSLPLRARWASVSCVLHLLIAPLCLPVAALMPAFVDRALQSVAEGLPSEPAIRDKTVIVTSVPDTLLMDYLPVMRSGQNVPRPRRQYWFVSTHRAVRLERRATNVMRVIPERGFYDEAAEARSPEVPLRVGDRVELSDMTVEVVALTSDGRPAICDFVFREPLDSSKYVWRTWRHDHLEAWQLPGVGQSATVSAS